MASASLEYNGPYPEEHDPIKIRHEASKKFESGDLEGARMVYQSALLDWVDDAREMAESSEEKAVVMMKEAIASLWISYANFNRREAKQVKVATEAFEAAVHCEVAGDMGRIWREYAQFQVERNRHKSAQKIYLRALVGDGGDSAVVKDEAWTDVLWKDFLKMMQSLKKDETLTLTELRAAVDTEHVQPIHSNTKLHNINNKNNINNFSNINNHNNINHFSNQDSNSFPNQHERGEIMAMGESAKIDQNISKNEPNKRPRLETNVAANRITPKGVEASSTKLMNQTQILSPDLTSEWLARDGDALPSRPYPPLFSPSPPKLADASGKDLLGSELALYLIRLLLKSSSHHRDDDHHDDDHNTNKNTKDKDTNQSILLDVCRGCWMMTALKEKEASQAIAALDEKMMTELEKMETELESRLTVSGAARSAVEQMNDTERNDFIAICNQQRQQLLVYIAWEFRHLLAVLQQILTNAGIPEFDGPTVDGSTIALQSNICSFLHSAFYLRSRIGQKQHVKMLKAQEERLASVKPLPMPPPPAPVPAPDALDIHPANRHRTHHLQSGRNSNSPVPPPSFPHHYPPQPGVVGLGQGGGQSYTVPPTQSFPLPPHPMPSSQHFQQQQQQQQFPPHSLPPPPPPIYSGLQPPAYTQPSMQGHSVPPPILPGQNPNIHMMHNQTQIPYGQQQQAQNTNQNLYR